LDSPALCLGLRATPTTVVEWTVVVGTLAAGVVDVGTVVGVGVAVGATVPGWAPPGGVAVAGVVDAGVLATGVVEAGVVEAGEEAGARVVEAVVPCTRADAGIGSPRARSILVWVLAAEARGLTARKHPRASPKACARTRTQVKPQRTTIILPMLTTGPFRREGGHPPSESPTRLT